MHEEAPAAAALPAAHAVACSPSSAMAERKSVSGPELRAKNGQTGARTGAGQGGVGARAGVATQARARRRASGAAASSRARAAGQVTREAVLVGRALCMSRRAPEFATDISNMTVCKLGSRRATVARPVHASYGYRRGCCQIRWRCSRRCKCTRTSWQRWCFRSGTCCTTTPWLCCTVQQRTLCDWGQHQQEARLR